MNICHDRHIYVYVNILVQNFVKHDSSGYDTTVLLSVIYSSHFHQR